jgi:hypothetical protein
MDPPVHAPASIPHGGIEQWPLSQYGFGPGPTQDSPHAPQLLMSFASLTHVPPQQLNRQPHSASVVQPPPVPEEELLDDDELEAEVLDELVAEELVVVGSAPP